MQSLSPDQYARLRRLASAWEQEQATDLAATSRANPRLGVDALCFQRFTPSQPDDRPATYLAGALVTPVSLSLVLVPAEPDTPSPEPGDYQPFSFPSGRYPFIAERLSDGTWLWRCELLDDLSDLEAPEEASRLAQRLMSRVMAPEA
ncbi:[NiFe]-hydrogenase assembly chaperone HybE [Halomonas sp. NO4]|uniref:[NiFe]-hydrogenase assembly chaperone HybE n=1 Tax=Halomonas sp. NO4 TaxID=2484813 RepID=UPI0013D7CB69|nr:[NiFe]-hydrogenase assembly chaperone HybE [Halomonas sp. NO4]